MNLTHIFLMIVGLCAMVSYFVAQTHPTMIYLDHMPL